MLKFLNGNQKNFLRKLEIILNKRKTKQQTKSSAVKKILIDVKKNGDKAIIKYEKRFSKNKTNSSGIKFSRNEINKVCKSIDKNLKRSIDLAFSRIKKFHQKQKFSSFSYKDKYKNLLSYRYSPIDRVPIMI